MILAILLAAVVLIILVVVVLFRVYLRADDIDPFDEVPDEPRRQAKGSPQRTGRPAPSALPQRPREPAMAAARPRPPGNRPRQDSRSQPGYRVPDRQPAPARRDSAPRPVPAAPRAARPGQATDWEKMSDVDYWTSLAAEKPLSESGPQNVPGPAPARRLTPEPVTAARQSSRAERRAVQGMRPRAADAGPGARPAEYRPEPPAGPRSGDYGLPQPAGPGGPRPADYDETAALARGTTPQEEGQRRSHSPGRYARGAGEMAAHGIAALARLGNQDRTRQDEPLPSGPPSRTDAALPPISQPHPRPRHGARPPADDDPLTSPSFPAITTSDSRSYRAKRGDSQPARIPAYSEARHQSGYGAISQPGGYPVQPAPSASNPYGSFVSQPAASHQQPAESYGSGGYAQPGSGNAWYGGERPTGAHAAPDRYAAAPGPYPAPVPADQNGYPGAAGYGHQGGYPGSQYDQRDYTGQDPGYGYQDYPRYGTGGY